MFLFYQRPIEGLWLSGETQLRQQKENKISEQNEDLIT